MKREYDRHDVLENHPRWLSRMDYKCQFTGKTVGKRVAGVYQRYNFHHTSSGAYGRERPGFNYILLCPSAHWFVHFLGGIIVPGRSVTIQNRRAKNYPLEFLWRMPNPLQRMFHCWCRLPFVIRHAAFLGLVVLILLELNTNRLTP